MYGDVDEQSMIHQAIGMVSAKEGCSIPDALALIKARAFRENVTTDDVAHRIVHGGLRLASEPQ
ncbi:ANTAR domain-containing protein [Streptomyces sp. NPDC059900]|uniref:ANTAR domain-containing protein n=1 Tax=Streptomyces sp. NPDC059900 TaxID=3155816 RepID=UPI00342750F3